MVKIIKLIFLYFVCFPSYGQVSFFIKEETRSIVKVSNYFSEDSEFWTGISISGIRIYRIIQMDTIPLYYSIGCTQYHMDNKNLNLYIWLDNYYEDDCLCADSEKPCKPDTSACDIKIKFAYTENKFTCSVSDFEQKNIYDTIKFKEVLKQISSSEFCKLSSFNKLFNRKSFDITNEIIDEYWFYNYYNFAIHYLKTNNKKDLYKLSYNLKRAKKINNKWEHHGEIPYRLNYIDNIIKYLWPMRDRKFTNEDISVFKNNIKQIILLSYSDIKWE